jgi:hypothetical protein
MPFLKIAAVILICVLASPPSLAQTQSFDGIACQSDVAKELRGRYMPVNERVAATQARYKDIDLKLLWGNAFYEEPISLISWQICGRPYALLADAKNIVHEVLSPPATAGQPFAYIADCDADGRSFPWVVVFHSESKPKWPVTVPFAWEADKKTLTFRRIEAKTITCRQ